MHRYQTKAQTFVEQYHILKKNFKLQDHMMLMYGSMSYINAKRHLDVQHIKDVLKCLREHASALSYFRGSNEMRISLFLSLQRQSEALLTAAKDIYAQLSDRGFKRGGNLPIVALYLALDARQQAIEPTVNKAKAIYDQMNQQHFWLTGPDDYLYAYQLAKSELTVAQIGERSNYYYQALSAAKVKKGNGLQSASHILSLSNQNQQANIEIFVELQQLLRQHGYDVKYYGLPILALLTVISQKPEQLANAGIQLADWLSDQRGFGTMSIDKNMRFAMATAIITDYHANDENRDMEDLVITATINQIIVAESIMTSTMLLFSAT